MILTPLPLSGAWHIALQPHHDTRGFFARAYCADTFRAHGLPDMVAQANLSFNQRKGTLRGLHFQRPPASDAKLVRCLRGAVHDVIVDLRAGSPTYGQWHSVTLSDENRDAVFVPPGFAHGFQTLTDQAELLYLHDRPHAPGHEGGLNHADPSLAIDWPLPVTILSDRDAALPLLSQIQPLTP